MKKNKLMRLASVLLVLTLLTTCVIGGTYAKYITSDSAKDVARVAKFGVVASISGDLFGPSYSADGGSTGNKIQTWGEHVATVSASSNSGKPSADVVAPGTVGDTMTFSVKGTPEVSTKVTVGSYQGENGAKNLKYYCAEPQLAQGTYGVMVRYTGAITDESIQGLFLPRSADKYLFDAVAEGATADTSLTYYELHDKAEVANTYKPLVWTVVNNSAAPAATTNTRDLSAAFTSIEGAFKTGNPAVDATFTPNTSNALSATLTWKWNFQNKAAANDFAEAGNDSDSIYGGMDRADTIMGDLIALNNGVLNEDQYVVTKSAEGEWSTLKTATVKVMEDSATDNTVTVAYIADPEAGNNPTTAGYAFITELGDISTGGTTNVPLDAVLGVAFDASLTVTQVD